MMKGTFQSEADIQTQRMLRALSNYNMDTDDLVLTKALLEMGDKSTSRRICALNTANILLSRSVLHKSAVVKRQRICAAIESSLGHANCDDEQELAAKLVPKLALNLGGSETIIDKLGPLMLQKASDKKIASFVRAQCSSSLALLQVMCQMNEESKMGSTMRAMEAMVNIFAGADETAANTSQLHSAALHAWSLLVSLVPAVDFCSMAYDDVPGIPTMETFLGLLGSKHSEVRLAAAKAIAVIFENGRRSERYFMDEHVAAVVDAIQSLIGCNSEDQGHTFYMVLRFVDEGKQPVAMFDYEGVQLRLLTWANHLLMSAFVGNLDDCIIVHLADNDFLRSMMHNN